MRRLSILLLALLVASPAAAAARNPTPLRVVAERAVDLSGDGERWVVVTRGPYDGKLVYDAHDTWTGRRGTLPPGCRLGGTAEQTTMLTAGRALLYCESDGPAADQVVLDLATGERTPPLPAELRDGDRTLHSAHWWVLGRRWVSGSGQCPAADGSGDMPCEGFYDFHTGAARIVPPDAPELAADRFRDLDAPELPVRRVCRPDLAIRDGYSHDTADPHRRRHAPPFFVGREGAYRCRDGKLLLRLVPDTAMADIVGDLLASGDPLRLRPVARVRVFDLRRRRDHVWTLPRPADRRRIAGLAVATRCAVFTSTTLRLTEDAYVNRMRVHRARLPGPRDPRCQA